MKLSVIIVNYNVKYFIEVCLHSVFRAIEGFEAEVIVVDNNSKDGSCDLIRSRFPQTVLIANKENTGFSKANNQGVAIARGAYILFLNPDTVMPEDFFRKTIAYMDAHPGAGALGPRLIDGRGIFAPDSKKSFPTLSVAIFKTTGINKIFSRSPYFNKYYAVHISEYQSAPVEVLSGCCMLVRSAVLDKIGGAFDEDYFMYCEDVDLSYRIQKAGYENIYFPDATLIHYKGESTKKATLSYVRVFNEALVTFVKKHYSKSNARLFILFINIGIILRGILGALKNVLRVLKMPLFDALAMTGILYGMNWFWVQYIKKLPPLDSDVVLATYPAYLLLWIISLYLNGAYDNPYRPLRVLRGMITGTLFILAYYGMLSVNLRYSRAVIFFSSGIGAFALIGLHELLHGLGVYKFVRYGDVPRKAAIVSDEKSYEETAEALKKIDYAPEIAGRIATSADSRTALSGLSDMKQLIHATGIKELIFTVDTSLHYEVILDQMQACGDSCDYKIHIPGSSSFVGSNSSDKAGDLYTLDSVYNLATFAQQRNKRVFDMATALVFLLLYPFAVWFVRSKGSFFANCIAVLAGRKTWVGYAAHAANDQLPAIRPGVLPVYYLSEDGYSPGPDVLLKMNTGYARKYVPGLDFTLVIKNFVFLGKK